MKQQKPCVAATEARMPQNPCSTPREPLQWEVCIPQLEKAQEPQQRPSAAKKLIKKKRAAVTLDFINKQKKQILH